MNYILKDKYGEVTTGTVDELVAFIREKTNHGNLCTMRAHLRQTLLYKKRYMQGYRIVRPKKKMRSYFNTNCEKHEVLDKSEKKARSQESIILKYFEDNPNKLFTPYDIERKFRFDRCSVGRAITSLTKRDKKLVKTNTKSMGGRGKKIYNWRLFITGEEKQLKLTI